MDFDDQEADEHEEPEPISISSEPANFINHLDTKSIHQNAAAAAFDPHAPPHRRPRFKECLKNHAVGIGGHTVDGCGEFMPAGEDGTLESLRCAACGCHRNFHRKEISPPGGPYVPHLHGPPPHQHLLLTHHPHAQGHFGYRNPSGYLVAAHHQQRAPAPLALPMSSGGGDDAGDEIYYSTPGGSGTGSGKKRCRTKFTQDQKDKMLQLALRLDWKIQKEDDETVQRFCEEVGIKRRVLKVWMHNNKQTLGKKT